MLVRSYKIAAPKRFENYIDDIVSHEGEAIVKIDKAAICKADLRYYTGSRDPRLLGLKYPLNLIHEAIGTVCRDSSGGFKPGERVVFIPNIIPGNIDRESLKKYDTPELGENYCPEALFASSNYDGFSREYISYPVRNLLKLPEGVSKDVLVFSELTSVANAALRRINIKQQDTVAVWGDGILGFILCSILKALGTEQVIAVGKHMEKLEEFPADLVFTAGGKDLKKLQIDAAYECVGGRFAEDAIDEMINIINIGGKIVLTGVSEAKIPINTRKILEKGISIHGITRSNTKDFRAALKLMENDEYRSNIEKLILGERKIRNIQDFYIAFEEESNNKKLGKYILDYDF